MIMFGKGNGWRWASMRLKSKAMMSMAANWCCCCTRSVSVIKSTSSDSQYGAPVPPLLPNNNNNNSLQFSRRSSAGLLISSLPFSFLCLSPPLLARDRRFNPTTIPIQDYLTSLDGLKYYDLVEGKGPVAEKGSTIQVHFDCIYRGITAVSSRESKLLAGNRIIAQPYELTVGSPPGKERKREFVDNPNGLFSAQAAPRPPPALYSVTEGMRTGGKRTVIVTPDKGYGQKGMNEIPPGATFQLNIELLRVVPTEE